MRTLRPLAMVSLLVLSPFARATGPESSRLSSEAALAGAVVAADDDGGGGWYNPASLGGLTRNSVQLGVSAYSYAWVHATGVLTTVLPWETQAQDTTASRYSSVPSVLGLTFRLREGLGLSVGLWTPFHDSFSTGFSTNAHGPFPGAPQVEATLVQRYDWAAQSDDTWAMAALGWQLHPQLRLGVALEGGLLTSEEWIELNTTLNVTPTTPQQTGALVHVRVREVTNSLAMRAVLGAQWAISKSLKVGVAVRSPQVQATRWGQHVQVALVGALLPGYAPQVASDVDTTPPTQGLVLMEPGRGLAGAVVDLGALSLRADAEWSPALASAHLAPSVRLRLGALYVVSPDLRIGLGTSFDSARTRASDGALSLDTYGLSGGLTYRADKVVKALGGGLWDLLGTVAVAGVYGVGSAPGMTMVPFDFSKSVVPVFPGASNRPFQEVPAWSLDLSIHFMTTVKF